MRLRQAYEKPSVNKARQKSEGISRQCKKLESRFREKAFAARKKRSGR